MYKVCQYDDFHIEYIRCYVFPTKEMQDGYQLVIRNDKMFIDIVNSSTLFTENMVLQK